MTRPNHRRAPQRGAGAGREQREWVRPFMRAHRALYSSFRLIASCLHARSRSERCAQRRPIRSSRHLDVAEARLATASARIRRAAHHIAELHACIARDPENAGDAPEILVETTERCVYMAGWLYEVADGVFTLHEDVLHGLASGALVPEPPPARRPRIVLAPRPAPVRAFLRARLPRVTDRISPVLHRRRRTPRPAAVSVPRRTSQGRAPPVSPVCPF